MEAISRWIKAGVTGYGLFKTLLDLFRIRSLRHKSSLVQGLKHISNFRHHVLLIGKNDLDPQHPTRAALFRVLNSSDLAYHRYLDLPRVGQLAFYFSRDVAAQQYNVRVHDGTALNNDPEFSPRLDRVGFGNPWELAGNPFEILKPLNVCLQELFSCPGR